LTGPEPHDRDDPDEQSALERWVLPYFDDMSLWPVLIVALAAIAAFMAPALVEAVRDLNLAAVSELPGSRIRELNDAAAAFNSMVNGLRWFENYVPRTLVRRLLGRGTDATTSQERQVTVMFTDIAGFTPLSEGMPAPELAGYLNHHFAIVAGCIEREGGTVDKFIGDAVMAFWGAPIRDEQHARHALETGIAMLERLNAIQEDFRARGWPEIRIGVGLNSGMMSVGDMGSKFRRAYTVLGDAVNLGSRLEGLTKNYGVEIIVGDATRSLVRDYKYRELDRVRVKGKDEPVAIYEPIAPGADISGEEQKELSLYTETLKLYRAQEWDRAEMQFINLQRMSPDRYLYQLYIDRIAQYRREPPGENWDGVFTHTSK